MSPVADARVPSYKEHLRCLNEEIRLAEDELGDPDKMLHCQVQAASPVFDGARLELQVLQGKPTWLRKGSKAEAFPGDDPRRRNKDSVNVTVEQRSKEYLRVEVDNRAWADLRGGSTIDIYPQSTATVQRNLLRAFLIARKSNPHYGDLESPEALPALGREDVEVGALRVQQHRALEHMLGVPEQGICLVQGPPGTGKTTVITRFLQEAAKRGLKALVTSHTHVAIDNALLKATHAYPGLQRGIVRLGSAGKVHPDLGDLRRDITDFHPDPEKPDAPSVLEALQANAITGMTLDALAVALIHMENTGQPIVPFDYVIVDEAGMNSFPKLALAHAVAKRLILVGDPLQLPPIIRAYSFRNDENYKRSHFEVIQRLRPDLATMLDEQFRCHPGIYTWSRDAIYGGRVQSPLAAVQKVFKVLGRDTGSPVVWLDTRGMSGMDAAFHGRSRINQGHVDVAVLTVLELIKSGVKPGEIGYISPFRAQAERFAAALEDANLPLLSAVTASTVDAFQGAERRVILYDLTTTEPGKPHEDHRRLNVSLTRAQECLIILGRRDFVKEPESNPVYWSLQNWGGAQVMPLRTST